MANAMMKFMMTPPSMMSSRCQAGLLRNSHGCGSDESFWFVSSIMPMMLT